MESAANCLRTWLAESLEEGTVIGIDRLDGSPGSAAIFSAGGSRRGYLLGGRERLAFLLTRIFPYGGDPERNAKNLALLERLAADINRRDAAGDRPDPGDGRLCARVSAPEAGELAAIIGDGRGQYRLRIELELLERSIS